ncbi:alkyl sulfatase C-terminal domain-containing protein [Streptomyces sp. 021-4]|uniref:alkyl sulfatase C-terminal domain-containing protein n=1 Tax=Streptomyces sp. 021-4 TaxID=2789260 RepID=UPI0039F5E33C
MRAVRLDADAAADTHLTLGFRFTDTGDACALEIRRGVAVFHPEPPPALDATLVTTAALIHQLLLGTTTPADALRHGDITVEGDPATVHTFFGYFDKPPTEPVKMVLR